MSDRQFRGLWLWALLALVFCAWDVAHSQTVTTKVNLTITPPTTNTDGSAIAGTLTYTLYQGPKAGPFAVVASGITATTTSVTSLASGNCFTVVAAETVTGSTSVTDSAPSPTVCVPVPGTPGAVGVSVTVTLS